MLTLFCHHLQRHLLKHCGIQRNAPATFRSTHSTQAHRQQSEGSTHCKHYLRSPYSIIHHHYHRELRSIRVAKSFVYNFPKLKGVEETQLDQIVKLVKEDGHCWKEVELFKEVLLLTPSEYKQRIQLLKDLSVSQPSLYHVLRMTTVMGCTVNALRKSIFDLDPLEHLFSAAKRDLKLSESILDATWGLCRRDDQMTLKQVYYFILKHYLAVRFCEDTSLVGSFLDDTYHPSIWKPLHHYSSMCDVIINCLGFSFSEIQDQPLLLFLDPDNTKEILQRFPIIGGISTKELVRKHPRLLEVPASQLDSWLRLLHKHQVWKFSYTHHTTVVFKTSSFMEVDKRLKILQGLQEWEVILASDILFEIIRSHRHTKRLINVAESGQIISSISSAIGAKEHTRHKQWHSITPEVVSYVAFTLDLPFNQIRDSLTDVYTPFGISNIKIVLRLLLDYGFTREQVVIGAVVLNFEADVVEQALRDLHSRPEVQPFAEWMENPFVLHLLAYCIKKDIPHLDLPINKVKLETIDLSVARSNNKDT